ncbi:hypothetical protein [Cobetia sp. ICG0124]|uniref:hypothetical protein n=1 Tax=Cobetia sp. ICG0124 TaxID=2053669 RepID=UPI000FD77F3D|nr:hypothetical protein [Cobetia sp. ICG0124]AZV31399.1 hypothetical protein CU110_08560 [Cobetia sp. ICG0124]
MVKVTVSGLETDATWEVSLDGGTTWNAGTGTTFTLDAGCLRRWRCADPSDRSRGQRQRRREPGHRHRGYHRPDGQHRANQIIKLEGVDITSSETLSDSDIIDALITDDQLLIGTEVNETDVSVTVVDGDGDTATGDITFIGEESLDSIENTAPEVTGDSTKLLGLVGLDALGVIDFSENEVFITDNESNLTSVVVSGIRCNPDHHCQ